MGIFNFFKKKKKRLPSWIGDPVFTNDFFSDAYSEVSSIVPVSYFKDVIEKEESLRLILEAIGIAEYEDNANYSQQIDIAAKMIKLSFLYYIEALTPEEKELFISEISARSNI